MAELEESKSVLKDLKDNTKFETDGGDPEPDCFSSVGEFRYRVWEFFTRWKYVILPCC